MVNFGENELKISSRRPPLSDCFANFVPLHHHQICIAYPCRHGGGYSACALDPQRQACLAARRMKPLPENPHPGYLKGNPPPPRAPLRATPCFCTTPKLPWKSDMEKGSLGWPKQCSNWTPGHLQGFPTGGWGPHCWHFFCFFWESANLTTTLLFTMV